MYLKNKFFIFLSLAMLLALYFLITYSNKSNASINLNTTDNSVIENGKKINSQLLRLPPGKSLDGANRKYFEIVRIKTDVLKSDLVAKFN